jgi:hypothetical protein
LHSKGHIYHAARKEVHDAFWNYEAITSTTSYESNYLWVIVEEVFRIYALGNFARWTNAPTLIDSHVVLVSVSNVGREVIQYYLMTMVDSI